MSQPRRNIEGKWRCDDLGAVRQRAKELGARQSGILEQSDTFFNAPLARLKLRDDFGSGKAELISYRRANAPEARGSDYVICPVANPAEMRRALELALGEVDVVSKRRELWLHDNTRIHLDTVDGLGTFVELETVLSGQTDEEGHRELSSVAEALELLPEQVVPGAYVDLLKARGAADGESNTSASRVRVGSGSPYEKSIGFSRAVRIGNIIAVSGTAPIGVDGTTESPGDIYRQTRRCLDISLEAIAKAGGKVDHVIRTRIMLTDASRWEEAARAHGEVFKSVCPACTFVEVKAFIRPDWLVETEVDCVISSAERPRT